MIELKKIIEILRFEDVRVLKVETPLKLCEILSTSIAFYKTLTQEMVRRGDRLELPVPDEFTNRKRMWEHFKDCKACMSQLRALYRESKSIDISLTAVTSVEDRRGRMVAEIRVVPYRYAVNVPPPTATSFFYEIE